MSDRADNVRLGFQTRNSGHEYPVPAMAPARRLRIDLGYESNP